MSALSSISSDTTVTYLLETYPHILQMFIDMRLQCVGCPAEGFHTLAEVAHEYKLDPDKLIENINIAIRNYVPAE
ncbi:MAG: hybrid cluster-associated redox disulfide protein [Desulforhopalus sp.]|jgi:hybrid cluster-associated redox disulfide protein